MQSEIRSPVKMKALVVAKLITPPIETVDLPALQN
jgi:hypothetical protein